MIGVPHEQCHPRELLIRVVTALYLRIDKHFQTQHDVDREQVLLFLSQTDRQSFNSWAKQQEDIGPALVKEALEIDATYFNNFEIPTTEIPAL